MKKTKENIIKYIDFKGITQSEFCKKNSLSNGFLTNNGNVGSDKIHNIIQNYPDINPEWLITGEGEMLREPMNKMKGLELKKIRKKLNETQTEFAEKIGVSMRTIQNWEGETRKIPLNVEKLIGNLIERNITHTTIPVDFTDKSIMYVPLVNQYAQAGYLSGFADDEYIEDLPKIPWATDLEKKGDYVCFEIKGDSMDDGSYESYLEGDILLCRNVSQDFWTSKLHINKWDFIIVHKEKGILIKRIIKHDVESGFLTLHSLNEYFQDLEVHINDIAKIFNVVDSKRRRNRR